MFNAIKGLKSFIEKYAPETKIIISTAVLRVDKVNANDISKSYIDLLNDNITKSDTD